MMTPVGDVTHNGCAYCGMMHIGVCIRVKSIEYFPDGTTKKVEFNTDPAPVTRFPPQAFQRFEPRGYPQNELS